jgi:hypothetical protein
MVMDMMNSKIDNLSRDVMEGDVFHFSYSENEIKRHGYYTLKHCFDGQLEAKKLGDKLILADTYWNTDKRQGAVDEWLKRGTLVFRFNLNEVEPLEHYNLDYYDDFDIFDFSYQSGCYKRFMLRKGAQKSKKKMLAVIEQRNKDIQSNIDILQYRLNVLRENLVKIEADKLDEVYF